MNLSIVIFCYNEVGNIKQVIDSCINILPRLASKYELVIVDDGSTDGTADIIKGYAELSFVNVVTHPINTGIGTALQDGYRNSKMEYVCALPGDGQFDVSELLQITPFPETTFYSFYRPVTNYTVYRWGLTWLNRLFNQHILAVYLRDVNWIKVYRQEHLKKTNPQLTSSLVESEICAKLHKLGVRPIEIPSKYLKRETGLSKGGSWKTLRLAIMDVGRLWWAVVTFRP